MKRREAEALRADGVIEKTEKGKAAAVVRPLLIAAIGAAVAGGRFLFGSAPFGAALICAVSGPLSVPAAFIGVSAGSLLSGGAVTGIPVFFSLFLGRLAISVILAREGADARDGGAEKKCAAKRGARIAALLASALLVRYDESVYIRMVLSSVASLAGGVLSAAIGGAGTAGFVSAAASSVISPVFVWLAASSRHWEKLCPGGGSGVRDAMLEEAGTTALCATVVLAFYAIRIPVVDLGVVAAFSVAVVSVRKSGPLRGLLRGFVCGAVISPRVAALIAFCAVVCGVVTRFADAGSVFSAAAAGVMWGYLESGLDVLSDVVPEMIVAVAVLTPAVALGLIPKAPVRRETNNRRGVGQEAAGGPTEKKLADLSRGLHTVSKELYRISDELTAPSPDDVRAVCEEAFGEVCAGCGLSGACRGAERGDADRVKEEIAGQLMRDGRASASAVSRAMAKRCYNVDRIIDGVNEKYSKRISEARVWDRTPVIASDYEAVAQMLKDAAKYDREEARVDGKLTARLALMLPDGGFYADSVTVYGKRRKRAVATGVRIGKTALGSEQIRELFGEACGIEFGEPSFSICGEEVNMELIPMPKIAASCGGASAAAGDSSAVVREGDAVNSACGDVIRTFETEDKRLYMLISDGMGSGKEACLTARMCASFLDTVLTSGAAAGTALKMLNSVIRARGTECSATVDLAEIDLLTGRARFIKSGAAPSFVVRDGRLFRLQSKTAPIGIIRALDAEMTAFDVESGDTVVMISDGVTRSFEEAPWLCEMLSDGAIAGESPGELAERIVRRAKEEGSCDDITAGVVKIK